MTDNIAKTSSQQKSVDEFNELNKTEGIVIDSLANLFDLLNDKSIKNYKDLMKKCEKQFNKVIDDVNKLRHGNVDEKSINDLKNIIFETIFERCAGIDMNKKNVENINDFNYQEMKHYKDLEKLAKKFNVDFNGIIKKRDLQKDLIKKSLLFVDMINETKNILDKCCNMPIEQQYNDAIELEMQYNEFTSKYINLETGEININQMQENFVKGNKDCLDMYAYMEKHVEKAKSQIILVEKKWEQEREELRKQSDGLLNLLKPLTETFRETKLEEVEQKTFEIEDTTRIQVVTEEVEQTFEIEDTTRIPVVTEEVEQTFEIEDTTERIPVIVEETPIKKPGGFMKKFGTCSGAEQVATGAQKTAPHTPKVKSSNGPQMIVGSN